MVQAIKELNLIMDSRDRLIASIYSIIKIKDAKNSDIIYSKFIIMSILTQINF
jgi:hypothetical protein